MDQSEPGSNSYPSRRGGDLSWDADLWLERWSGVLEAARGGTILELGAGGGRDTRYLVERGYRVLATDASQEALALCRERLPDTEVRHVDLGAPLPFPDRAFPVVLASLCLHFLPWAETEAALTEIRRCLEPGGFLLGRVNSRGDLHPERELPAEIEPGLFRLKGGLKRFFSREDLERLAADWQLLSLQELTVERYGSAKVLWEFLLQKPQ